MSASTARDTDSAQAMTARTAGSTSRKGRVGDNVRAGAGGVEVGGRERGERAQEQKRERGAHAGGLLFLCVSKSRRRGVWSKGRGSSHGFLVLVPRTSATHAS